MNINLRKKSWHYAVAMFGTPYIVDHVDICTYSGMVFKGVLAIIATILVIPVIILSMFDAPISFVLMLITGHTIPFISIMTCSIGGVLYGMLLIRMVFLLINMALDRYRSYRNNGFQKQDKKDSFLKNAYRSYKDKYCVKISFTE